MSAILCRAPGGQPESWLCCCWYQLDGRPSKPAARFSGHRSLVFRPHRRQGRCIRPLRGALGRSAAAAWSAVWIRPAFARGRRGSFSVSISTRSAHPRSRIELGGRSDNRAGPRLRPSQRVAPSIDRAQPKLPGTAARRLASLWWRVSFPPPDIPPPSAPLPYPCASKCIEIIRCHHRVCPQIPAIAMAPNYAD
jgi:hypothetical protein